MKRTSSQRSAGMLIIVVDELISSKFGGSDREQKGSSPSESQDDRQRRFSPRLFCGRSGNVKNARTDAIVQYSTIVIIKFWIQEWSAITRFRALHGKNGVLGPKRDFQLITLKLVAK